MWGALVWVWGDKRARGRVAVTSMGRWSPPTALWELGWPSGVSRNGDQGARSLSQALVTVTAVPGEQP